jgi:hypothetical protein
MRERLSPREARQGRKGVHVLMVLIAALIVALIAWVVIDFYAFSQGEPEETTTPPAAHLDHPSVATPQQSKPAPTPAPAK